MTRYEKGALIRFLGLYLISMSALAIVIAFLVYRMEKRSAEEMEHYKIRHFASQVASYIVTAHMTRLNTPGDIPGLLAAIPVHPDFTVRLYDADKKPLAGAKPSPVPLEEGFSRKEGSIYLVERSTHMHLGVEYVLIEARDGASRDASLAETILFWLGVALVVIAVVGYFLAKLFLIPVKREMERLDRFIKDTTHELNTPIAAILMSISSLKKQGVDEKITGRIALAARRVSDIYRDLTYLFFHELTLHEAEPVDMASLCRERLEYFRPLAELKHVTLESRCDALCWQIDRESAVRLVDNLLSNAIKYKRPGGKVRIDSDTSGIIVSDTGIGMDEITRKNIFTRYQRGKGSEQGGFGIGMDIVASIAVRYGITIRIESDPGKGTRIRLEADDQCTVG